MPEIVFPKNNEKDFIQIAKKLGIKQLFFVYPFKKDIANYKSKIETLQKLTKISLKLGLLASPNDIFKAKKICDFVVSDSSDQHSFEKLCPNIIFDLEKNPRREHTRSWERRCATLLDHCQ